MTIHKSQGLTIQKTIVDLSLTGQVAGYAYVALSRAENLSDCIVEQASFDRLQMLKNQKIKI